MESYCFTHLPFKIVPESNLLLVKVNQKLLFEELVWHPSEFMSHEDFRPGVNILYDLTAISEITGDLELLVSSIDRLKEDTFIPTPARTAFCTAKDTPKVMQCLKGVCIMTRGSRVEHQVFDDLEQALLYLSLTGNELAAIESELSKLAQGNRKN